jgi:CheY-like chemotaxis protein
VSDGAAGIVLAMRERPDLLLLDVMMVSMNGLVVCERLRAEPTLAETPIVLLTVLEDVGVRDRGHCHVAQGVRRGGAGGEGDAAPRRHTSLCDALISAAPRIAVADVSLGYIARLEIGRHNRASGRSAHWRRRSR